MRENSKQCYRTALHFAAEGGNYPLCALLLEKGADTTMVDIYGKTPAECTKEADIVQLIQNKNPRPKLSLEKIKVRGSEAHLIISSLIQR
jgi:hypothetical protein